MIKSQISFQSIADLLQSRGISFSVIDHVPVYTMEDVAAALSIPAKAMAKTMLFSMGNGDLIAVVLPGLNKVDYAKVAKLLCVKRQALRFSSEEEVTSAGLLAGAVSPLSGVFRSVFVDTVLLAEETIYCGSGDLSKTIQIAPSKLVEVASATVADVSKSSTP